MGVHATHQRAPLVEDEAFNRTVLFGLCQNLKYKGYHGNDQHDVLEGLRYDSLAVSSEAYRVEIIMRIIENMLGRRLL